MRRGIIAALLVLVAACPKPPPRPRTTVPLGGRSTGAQPDPDRERQTLADELRVAVLDGYRASAEGREDACLDGLVRDERLLLIDVGPGSVIAGFDPAACGQRRLLPGEAGIVSKILDVQIGADAKVAWVYDEISYRVRRQGRIAVIPLRVTAVFERGGGRWQKVQEHISYALPDEEARVDAASGAAPAPISLGAVAPADRAGREVRGVIVGLVANADPALRERFVARDATALVLGSDARREARGADIAAVATVAQLYGDGFRASVNEEVRVGVARSATVAWAAANLIVEVPGQEAPLRVRATWVLERRGGSWQVVQTHVSLPVTRDRLARRVFGE